MLPKDILLAIEGRERREILIRSRPANMVAEHCVEAEIWNELEPAPEVLCIVDEVLPANPRIRMTENLSQRLNNNELFFLRPVPLFPLFAHKRDAERIQVAPRNADASDVPSTSLNITGKVGGLLQ